MASIIDVAKYILKREGSLSTMKLQKLCYYSQAWSLVWDDAELFDEDFEAWANGPVCKELFDIHKGMFRISYNSDCLSSGDEKKLNKVQRETIDTVLDYYADKNAQWLSTLTHMEEPWKNARAGIPNGCPCSNTITKESMAMYYGSL